MKCRLWTYKQGLWATNRYLAEIAEVAGTWSLTQFTFEVQEVEGGVVS